MDNQNNGMFSNMMQPGVVPEVKDDNNINNAVQGNGFSNMIQPTAIPEVKDSSNSVQGNNLNSNIQGNNLNQINNTLSFEMPQSNTNVEGEMTNNLDLNSIIPGGVSQQPNGNSFINNTVVNTPLESNNIMPQNDNNSSNFGFSMPNETINSVNNANDSNLGVVDSNVNNVEQSNSTQSTADVNNSIGVGSTIVNEGLNMDLSNNNDLGTGNTPSNLDNGLSSAQDSKIVDNDKLEEVVSVKKYLVHMFLGTIPVVGIIILIKRALDRKDKNISNLARAQLLLSAVVVLISVVLMFVIRSVIATMVNNMY